MKRSSLILLILPVTTLLAQSPNFSTQVVDNQIAIGYGMAIGDVDGDRKPDILLADQKEIVWYKNPGSTSTTWPRYVMARNLTPQDNVCIAARDLDGDGRVEVAVGAGWNPAETDDSTKSGAVFYLIRPADPAQLWEPVRLPHEVTTHRMKWVSVGNKQFQLVVVPLHGLGNRNGVGRGVRIWGYALPKNPRSPWKQYLVDSTLHLTHNLAVRENGPTTSLVIASKEGGKVVHWRGSRWVHEADQWLLPNEPMGELRTGTPDLVAAVEPMHGNQLVVDQLPIPGKVLSETERGMVRKVLTDKLNQGHALVVADFLGIGRDQVVVGWRNPNADKQVGVRLFVPTDTHWQEYPIDNSVMMACEDLQAADLDGDGDLDLIASGRATLNLLIYWNHRIK